MAERIASWDVKALVRMVHPRYADDVGTPDPADDLDRAAVARALRQRLARVSEVRYRMERPAVRWEAPDRAVVDVAIEASYRMGGRWMRHADGNRFVLQRHAGRWLFLRGM